MSKKRKGHGQKAKQRPGPRKVKRARSRSYGLIIGAIVLAVVVVVALVALNQGSRSSPTAPGQVSLDKSKGAADAPVVVVEYGDFQ
jgi:hypothetical protein